MYRVTLKILAALLLLSGMLLAVSACRATGEDPVPETLSAVTELTETFPPETEPTTEPEPQEERFTLTFVGDCTFGSNAANWYAPYGFVLTAGEDYSYPFQNVSTYFENDDFTMINLEGPLCDSGSGVQKKHVFHGLTSYVHFITDNSIEAVTIANNHTQDYGSSGYESTVQTLQDADVPYVEANASTIVTTERGLTIGIYAAVYNSWDHEDMKAEVAALREKGVDLVIYAVHWGTEGSYHPVSNQVELAHEAIDAGVDIVYGSHPHVLQNVETYNGGIIYYSLGNFCFGGNIYPRDLDSAVLQQEIIRDPDGTVRLGELTMIPCSVSSISDRNNFQPTPYEEGTEEYTRAMSKLDGTWTGHDLPIG